MHIVTNNVSYLKISHAINYSIYMCINNKSFITTVLTFRNLVSIININHYTSRVQQLHKIKKIWCLKLLLTQISIILYRLYTFSFRAFGNIINLNKFIFRATNFFFLAVLPIKWKYFAEEETRTWLCLFFSKNLFLIVLVALVGYNDIRWGLASLPRARRSPRILAANFNAHARFQFTVRVCGERVEASVYDPDSNDLRWSRMQSIRGDRRYVDW